jgi:acetolactate synthase-1/3 small subunit
VTVEITGTRQEIETAVEAFERFEIREIVRTGTTALERGARETADTPVADD